MSNDPLLQPYQLKHLTLRNRIMTTSHEPAYPEDGMPKARYAAYHAERAKAGVALAMTAGSAALFATSPIIQTSLAKAAGPAATIAFALNGSMLYFGQGLGAALGGWVTAQFGLAWVGVAGMIVGLATLAMIAELERRAV